ncbi:MAG TPA: GGDEF domain-containing protein [Noviherbaspirillum sp.]|nr:GGDEF domain-containing protein [Noviherbaspirillum sp.]
MSKVEWPTLFGMRERNDALAAYRGRVIYMLAVMGAIVMLPLAAANFAQGKYVLGFGDLFGVLFLAVDAVALHRKRPAPIPFALILVPAFAGVVWTIHTQGFSGALWSYPALLLFHFALSRRVANAYGLLLMAVTSVMVYHLSGADITIRYASSLLVTIILINLALNIVDDLHRRLIAQTSVDPLTGAYNRRHMESCLAYAIERSRCDAAPASLLLIDIDHFKRINDEHGHAVGDAVLKELVAIINGHARAGDLLFRTGGEEFLLLMPGAHEDDAVRMAEALRVAVSGEFCTQAAPATVSIGVSELRHDETMDAWLKHADDALYRAKEQGRNRVVHRTARPSLRPEDARPD